MGQNERTVKLTVDVATKVSDMSSQLNKIQKELSKLKMPDNLKGSVEKSLDELENRIKNVQQYTKGNKISLLDEKKIRSEVNSIGSEFDKIFKKINSGSNKITLADKFKVARKEADALQKAIDNYYSKIAEGEKQTRSELGSVRAKRSKAENTKEKNVATKTVAETNLKEVKEQLVNLRGLETVTEEAAAEIEKLENQEKKLQTTINGSNQRIAVAEEQISRYDKEINELNDSLNKIKADSLLEVTKALSDAQKAGEIKLDFDPSSIKSIDELRSALKDIDSKNLEKASRIIEKFSSNAIEGAHAAEALGGGIEESTENAKELDNTLENFKNKVKYFFGLENAVNLFKRGVSAAFETVKDLDAVMTETAVVTDFSVGDMWDQLPEYTKRANELGVSIHDAYEAATLYYQQGLSTNEVMAVSNETLKMARIAGLDAAEATDRMTNALRGFNMEITEANAQNINDVYSNLAAKTASDVNEISVAMTKVASLANNANMSFENTAAFLAQIIETTRESAETAGTALKTVIARFSEVKELRSKGELLGTDEEGEEIDVNKVSQALRSAGINLNEYLTGAKGLDEIFIELSAKWDSLDQVQQRYIATMAAGSRQQSRFIALMQDSSRMTELLGYANDAAGASQEQFAKTLDSLQTKLNQLKNAWDTFLMTLANNEAIKLVVDLLTKLIGSLNKVLDTVGKFGGSWAKSFAGIGLIFGGLKLGKTGGNKLLGSIGKNLGIVNKELEKEGKESESAGEKNSQSYVKGFKEGLKKFFTTEKIISKELVGEPSREALTSIKKSLGGLKIKEGESKGNKLTDEQKQEIITVYKTKGYESAVQAASKYGVTLNSTNQAVRDWGGQVEQVNKKVTISYRAIGVILTTVGAAMNHFVKESESTTGKIGQALSDTFSQAGTALMTFGPLIKALPTPLKIAAGAGLFLVNAFKAFKSESPEEKLKKVQEKSEAAAKGAEEATKRYDDLKSSLDSLKESQSNIEKMTVGTTEWKNAVQDTNKQVLDLIENYGELAKYVKNNNGQLTLDTNSPEVQSILNNQSKGASNAQLINISTQRDLIEAQNKALTSKQQELLDPITASAFGTNEDVARALAGDAESIKKLGVTTEQLAEAAEQNGSEWISAMRKTGEILLANDSKLEAYYKATAAQIESSEKFTEEQNRYINNFLSSDRLKAYEDAVDTSKYEGENRQKLQNELAGRLGYSNYDDLLKARNVEEISDKEISAELAKLDAMDKATEATREFAKALDGSQGELLKSIYGKENGLGLNEKQAKRINSLSGNTDVLYTYLTGKEVTNEIRDSTEYEQITSDAISASTNSLKVINKYLESLPEKIKDSLENADAGTVKTFNEFFNNIAAASGKEASENISNYLKGLSTGDLEKVAAALNMIDPRNIDEVENLPNILANLGGESIFAESKMQGFIKAIEAGAHSVKQFNMDNIIEQIRTIGQLQKDIRTGEHDRTFSEDEYNNLIKVAPEIAADFEKDLSGNYVYVGQRMENLTAALDENTRAVLEEANKQLDNQIKAAEVLGESSYLSYEGGTPHDVVSGLEDRASLQGQELKDVFQGYLDNLRAGGVDLSTLLGIDQNSSADFFSEEQIHSYLDQLFTIMNNYAENKAAQATATQEGRKLTYQSTNTAIQNADLGMQGDDAAVAALKVQAAQAGITQEAYAELYAEIEKGSQGAIFELGEITTMFEEASKIGIDASEITHLATELRKVNKELDKTTSSEIAFLNIKFNKGLKQIIDSYEDWNALIDENTGLIKANVAEDSETFNSLKESVNMMLNTTAPLSDAFWENAENIKLVQDAAEGVEGAYQELREAAAQDVILSIQSQYDPVADRELWNEIGELQNELANLDLPELEPGMNLETMDEGINSFIDKCNQMLADGKLTAEQLGQIWKAAGFNTVLDTSETETVQVAVTHGAVMDPTTGISHSVGAPEGYKLTLVKPKMRFEAIGGANYSNVGKGKGNTGGTPSGSSGSTDKVSHWQNPYDELYNELEKINELIRERTKLERQFEQSVRDTSKSNTKTTEEYNKQIQNLEDQIKLQKKIADERMRVVKKLNSLTGGSFYNSEGEKKTYSSVGQVEINGKMYGLKNLAQYNEQEHRMIIDWNTINNLPNYSDEAHLKFAEALESYISELEKLSSSAEEYYDAADEIRDTIDELNKSMVDSFKSLEDRVLDAVIAAREKEIDKLENLSDTIKDSSDKVIDDMRQQVEAERQARQNEKTEEEIAQKESRLEYLRRDTSGANQKEILQLEKELEESRQSYQDSLIDQSLQQMQNEADVAAEQRANQIEIMREQLRIDEENGTLWKTVGPLIQQAFTNGVMGSELEKLLKNNDLYNSLSSFGKQTWINDLTEAVKEANIGFQAAKVDKNGNPTEYKLFKTGGLADFTGPAWLDGTKTKPELVLNQQDTQNFISLIDTLSSLNKSGNQSSLGAGGNNYYDIDISAELGSDYDVDQLAEEIKRQIQNDSAYRNTTSIGFIR